MPLLPRNLPHIVQPFHVFGNRLQQALELPNLTELLQHLLQGHPLLLQRPALLFQLADALPHTRFTNVSPSGVVLRIHVLQTVAVVQDTVRRHAHAAPAQLLHTLTFHHIPEEKINICLHMRLPRSHFPCQRSGPYRMFLLQNLLRIQHRGAEELFLIHLLVNVHGSLCILRLHHQKQLIIPQISFHGIVPPLIPDIQQIRQNLYIHKLPAALVQPVAQLISGLLKLLRVCLAPLPEFF